MTELTDTQRALVGRGQVTVVPFGNILNLNVARVVGNTGAHRNAANLTKANKFDVVFATNLLHF